MHAYSRAFSPALRKSSFLSPRMASRSARGSSASTTLPAPDSRVMRATSHSGFTDATIGRPPRDRSQSSTEKRSPKPTAAASPDRHCWPPAIRGNPSGIEQRQKAHIAKSSSAARRLILPQSAPSPTHRNSMESSVRFSAAASRITSSPCFTPMLPLCVTRNFSPRPYSLPECVALLRWQIDQRVVHARLKKLDFDLLLKPLSTIFCLMLGVSVVTNRAWRYAALSTL